jgi:hypothetical protein
MTGNEALYKELSKSLDSIRNKIKSQKTTVFKNDLNELSRIIDSSFKKNDSLQNPHHSAFFNNRNDIVKCIMKIINKIDKAIGSVEIEMHGVLNYSSYENKKVQRIEFKQTIKDDLNKMLKMIIAARPDMRDAELLLQTKRLK